MSEHTRLAVSRLVTRAWWPLPEMSCYHCQPARPLITTVMSSQGWGLGHVHVYTLQLCMGAGLLSCNLGSVPRHDAGTRSRVF